MVLIASHFGSREIFLDALLGIILVILAHRVQIFTAGMLTMFGIFLQSVGLDAVTYTQRYTFGLTFLTSGINLIVVILGLFALSQAFLLLTAPTPSPLPADRFQVSRNSWSTNELQQLQRASV